MSEARKVEAQPAFVLHAYPYRETSLIIEVFARDHGRLAIVARGARRPKSAVRGVLMAFQPLLLSWFGKSDLKTLHAAEWQGGMPQMSGLPLICGFYLNELLLNLLAREDPHEQLFEHYGDTLCRLSQGAPVAPILRRFELRLLEQLGYGLDLTHTAAGQAIEPGECYRFEPNVGLVLAAVTESGAVAGRTLLAMAEDRLDDPAVLAQSKALMRSLIGHQLGDRPLHTRRLLHDLNQL